MRILQKIRQEAHKKDAPHRAMRRGIIRQKRRERA